MMPAVGLLDTNILVDMLRGYRAAITWMQTNFGVALAIPPLVRMEIVLGAQNKTEQDRVTKLLSPYPILYPSEIDAQLAMTLFETHHLSHQVEIIDCFIAAMSIRWKLPIYTRNVKDLGVFPGIIVRVPY
jgi:predicted nucleic acid-binding protein